MTFEELYKLLAGKAIAGELGQLDRSIVEGEQHNLDCLLNGGKSPLIISQNNTNCNCRDHACVSSCLFDAIQIVDGKIEISNEKCVGCGACIDACGEKKITATKDLIEVIGRLKSDKKVYALLAPAIVGQFGDDVSIGKIRTALKEIGFAGVVEVATFADILTLREAIEFAHKAGGEGNYQLTSCCCPVWIALIKKNYDKLSTHLTPAVSPMIAAGRCVKRIAQGCVTVFISPCLAKRAEAREADVVGAIDNVITFHELSDLFQLLQVDLGACHDEDKDHSSYAGRIYAVSGGVSTAVKDAYNRIVAGGTSAEAIGGESFEVVGEPRQSADMSDVAQGVYEASIGNDVAASGGESRQSADLSDVEPSVYDASIGNNVATNGGENIACGDTVTCKVANGIAECKAMLSDILEGKIEANFYEGMGCNGGCVAGAKVIVDKAISTQKVKDFASKSKYQVPIDNPYVVKILAELGMKNIGDLLHDQEIFCRKM